MKLRVYSILERSALKRSFSFRDQLADAARSAPSNIAEGFGRFGNKEFARFARIVKASEIEVLNHLVDARDQRLISDEQLMIEEHHVRRALKEGATADEINHTLLLLTSTIGFPAVAAALSWVDDDSSA